MPPTPTRTGNAHACPAGMSKATPSTGRWPPWSRRRPGCRWPDTGGLGTTASSDGQFFATARQGEAMNLVNAKHGYEPGLKAYTHLSDQFAPFTCEAPPPWAPAPSGRASSSRRARRRVQRSGLLPRNPMDQSSDFVIGRSSRVRCGAAPLGAGGQARPPPRRPRGVHLPAGTRQEHSPPPTGALSLQTQAPDPHPSGWPLKTTGALDSRITTVRASLSCQPCLRLSNATQRIPRKNGRQDTK